MLNLHPSFLQDVDPEAEQPKRANFYIVKRKEEVKIPRNLWGLWGSKRNKYAPFFWSLCTFSRTRRTPWNIAQDFFSCAIENCEFKKTFY